MPSKLHSQHKHNNTSYVLYYHVVLITEKRDSLIDQQMAIFLEAFFIFKCKDLEVRLLEQKILSDHVHLLLSLRPAHYIPKVVNYLKGTASHEANYHQDLANELYWLRGYHIDPVSKENLNAARAYIKTQYQRHPERIPLASFAKKVNQQERLTLDDQHKPNDTDYVLYYHVVWVTKYRMPLIDMPIANFLGEFFASKCEELAARLVEQNRLSDHVHLSLNLRPIDYIPDVINVLKGAASHEVNHHEDFTTLLYWTKGYHISTVSKPDLHVVKRYIQNQYAHHPDKIPNIPTLPPPVNESENW